jgi:rhodanese-related sulfurtransferase
MNHHPGFLKLVAAARRRIDEVTVEEVAATLRKRKRFVLIDIREDREWAAGHIRGSVHIGKGVIERDIEGKVPAKRTPIVLYCGGGYRSALAATALQSLGYRNVASMAGGWKAWKRLRATARPARKRRRKRPANP